MSATNENENSLGSIYSKETLIIRTAIKLGIGLSELEMISFAQLTELAILESKQAQKGSNEPTVRKATQADMDRF